ncbi:MAG: glycosyltransferase [bacterium]|nr:glycosyltransferase [bacterium]
MMPIIEYVRPAIYLFALLCLFTHGVNCYLLMALYHLNHTGFKAGALHEGLMTAKGELIGIFDADFIPQPNFSLNSITAFEFFLGIYSFTGRLLFLFFSKFLVSPFLLIYTSGFFYVFFFPSNMQLGNPGHNQPTERS